MAASLKTLELEDFKTYYGKHVVGPFQPFTGIVGPNGGGKSNLMDAIAFVLGGRLKGLRVTHFSQLINRDRIHSSSESETDSPPPSTSVTAVFALQDGGERVFKRILSADGSKFLVNGKSVSWARYQRQLKEVGVNTICRNFMVFQGTVENIATEGNRMKTELFEEISGSGELAEKYKSSKEAMEKAAEKATANFERQQMVVGDLKDCQVDLKKEDEYKALEKECEKTQIKLQLLRLYCVKKEAKSAEEELKTAESNLEKLEEKRVEQDQLVEKKVEELAVAVKDVTALDHSFGDLEIELTRKRAQVITAKEVLVERKKKEESCHKLLAKAREGQEAQQREVKALEEELQRVEGLAAKYEEELSQESLRMGTDIHLEEEQLEEYHRLKQEAAQRCAPYQQTLGQLSRQHKIQLDSLANEERRISELRAVLSRKEEEVKEAMHREDCLKEKLRSFTKAKVDKDMMLKEYKEKVNTNRKNLETVKKELEKVTEELSEATWDESQAERQRAKEELVQTLRFLFPGVHDRLSVLCQPIHERYQLAITRVLLKHLDSIVVDSVVTAQRCMRYLADKCIGRETFLPLNYLSPSTIRESLRAIQEPQHVKLAFDLVKFEPHFKVAVLFATKDTLVCETPEDAMTVAYELQDEHGNERRLSAVALDGTFYSKSGLVSGGKMELQKKARRWGEKNMVKMRNRRNSLLEDLRKAQRVGKEEFELNLLETQITGLGGQIKYIAIEVDKTLKYIDQIKEEIQKTEDDLENLTTAYEMKTRLTEQETEITELQTEMERAENEVFASFCEEIHVPSIRLYEEQGLQTMTERANKRLQFEKQKSRIQSQINYERSRDKKMDVERWEIALEAQRVQVEEAKKEEEKKTEETKEVIKTFAQEKAKRINKARVVREMEEQVEVAQEQVRKLRKERMRLQQKIFFSKQKIKSLEVDRHNILKHCRIKGLNLPLKSGSLQIKALREEAPISTTSFSQSSSDPTQDASSSLVETEGSMSEIKVDYSLLPSILKKVKAEKQKEAEGLLQLKIRSLEKRLSVMHPPSKYTNQRLQQATVQMKDMKLQLGRLQREASDAQEAFKEVKQQRYDLFMDCFTTVAAKIDEVYKGLCQSNQAQALLETTNPQEPYLGSIIYHCIPPGKRCQSMGGLSGGEKSVAALAFLFALHSYHPAPFFLLDEVDAALDRGNIYRVSKYIHQLRENVEVLLISHRLDLYHKADALFGVTFDMVNDYARSKVFSLDLTQYRRDRTWRRTDGGDSEETHSSGRDSDSQRAVRTHRDGRGSDGKRRDGRDSEEIHSGRRQGDSQHTDRRRHRDGRDSDEIQSAGTRSDETHSDEIRRAGTHSDEMHSDGRQIDGRHRDGRDSDERQRARRHTYSRHRAGGDSDEIQSAGTRSDETSSEGRRRRDGRDSARRRTYSRHRVVRDSDAIQSAGTHSDETSSGGRQSDRQRLDVRDGDEIQSAGTQA